jgi:hypothetical protein
MSVKISNYKGHPTISLNAEARYPFTFGLEKARLILSNLQAIRDFVDGAFNDGLTESRKRCPAVEDELAIDSNRRKSRSAGQPDYHDMAVEDRMAEACGYSPFARPE